MILPLRKKVTRRRPKTLGFTLIEITIAVGIIGTGVLLLMGLMPTGISTLQEASSKSMGRRIAQNIISEILLYEWGDVHKFDHKVTQTVRYFDNQGIELRPAQRDQALFRARVRIMPRDVILDLKEARPTQVTYALPDDPPSFQNGTVTNMRRVHVDITNIPSPDFDIASNFGPPIGVDNMDPRVETFSALISNMSDTDSLPPSN